MRPERQQSPVLSSLELTLVFAELCKFFRTRNGNFRIFRSFFKEKANFTLFREASSKTWTAWTCWRVPLFLWEKTLSTRRLFVTVLQSPECSIISVIKGKVSISIFLFFLILLSFLFSVTKHVFHNMFDTCETLHSTFNGHTEIMTSVCYRPQRSWGKVMFLHVSVILFTGGVCPIAFWDTQTPPGTRHTLPLGSTPLRADPPSAQCILGDTGNKRAVRILLECNLVIILLFQVLLSSSWLPKEHMTPWVESKIMFLFNELVPGFFWYLEL